MPDQTPSMTVAQSRTAFAQADGMPHSDAMSAVDGRPVFFLHIPKTAGTSFLTTLQNLFGEEHVLRLAMEDPGLDCRIRAVADGEVSGVSCLNGHLPVDVMTGRLERFRPFTILRDPIARMFSLFRFQRKNPNIEALGLRRNFSFEEFLAARATEIYAQTTNGMCRMLAGQTAFTLPGDAAYTDVDNHPELIERALELLERIDFGIAEDMVGTHRIIEQRWGVPFALDEMMLNTTEPGETHKDWRNIRAVVACNQLDIVLYERAKQIFQQRMAALGEAQPTPAVLDTRMVFQPTLGAAINMPAVPGRQGFHAWEDSGIAWLNEGPASRIHFLPPAPIARVSLRVFGIGTDYPFDRIKLHLHGYPLPFSIVDRQDSWCTLQTRLARSIEGVNTLSITAPAFVPVRSIDPGSVDPRNLGIAVQSIMFTA